jgi:hypothetical protein
MEGMKVGRLTLIRFFEFRGEGKSRKPYWLCRCDCGNEKVIYLHSLTNSKSPTISCGCVQRERTQDFLKRRFNVMRGRYGEFTKTKIYNAFRSARQRCLNKNGKNYASYGGRGIKFLWSSKEEFFDDMLESFNEHVKKYGEKNTTLERIDVDGHYCKDNCRWATWKEQAINKRRSRRYFKYKRILEFLKKNQGIWVSGNDIHALFSGIQLKRSTNKIMRVFLKEHPYIQVNREKFKPLMLLYKENLQPEPEKPNAFSTLHSD